MCSCITSFWTFGGEEPRISLAGTNGASSISWAAVVKVRDKQENNSGLKHSIMAFFVIIVTSVLSTLLS